MPLPYLFASLAYPSVVAQARRFPASPLDTVADKDHIDLQNVHSGGQLLHACTLSSTTLLLIGLVAKIKSSLEDPLDRRKPLSTAEKPTKGQAEDATSLKTFWRMILNVLGVLLPFYASMQLGGAKASLILLSAATAGLGCFNQAPGKHGTMENTRTSFRSRKWTWCSILLIAIIDTFCSIDTIGSLFGYGALGVSVAAVPFPLPTAGWLLNTIAGSQDGWNTQNPTRASLPNPSSPLVDTSTDTNLTLVSGAALTCLSVLYSSFAASSPSLSQFSIIFSTLSVASAAALVFTSIPSALRSKSKAGFALGGVLIAACGVWDHVDSWQSWCYFPLASALVFGAIVSDTRYSSHSRPTSHGHAHAGHSHSHSHPHSHDHHLHGNHSSISKFLIARCTPGSILHSIMIEKDSRRIAYFGVLVLLHTPLL